MHRAVGFVLVVALFCVPLFVGLDGWDLRNDEAIYSYAVDRILQTGEWLTPRSIQVDGPFLEKPPLKFWMVAAAIRSGLAPHDEVGLRLVDAGMGAVAFLYIYCLGLRIAGPVCGVVAALATFSIDAIVFDHGLRSNTMEAPLVLSCCGGVYHFSRWVDDSARARLHAYAFAMFFVLGFMTKFVAALFLPAICLITVFVVPLARQRLLTRWRDWIGPLLMATAAIAPWFVYESFVFGRDFWRVIVLEHVYARFTAALDPSHVQPWHFYFTQLWRELTGQQFAAVVSVVVLSRASWTGRPWHARLLLAWWLVPFVLMSFGTSKLFHYTYPFLPALALAIGLTAQQVYERLTDPRVVTHVGRGVRSPIARAMLVTVGIIAIGLAGVSAIEGQVVWRLGGVKLLQNSSVVRPLLIAAVCFALGGWARASLRAVGVVVLILTLPILAYPGTVTLVTTVDSRLRTLQRCASRVRESDPQIAAGVLNAARSEPNHADYYYLSRLGPWVEPENATLEEVRHRVFDAGAQTPIRMTRRTYGAWIDKLRPVAVSGALPPAAIVEASVFVLPGPYSHCAAAVSASVSTRLLPAD